MKAGKVLKLNEAGNDYDVCLPMPTTHESIWPNCEDEHSLTDSGMDESNASFESGFGLYENVATDIDPEEW